MIKSAEITIQNTLLLQQQNYQLQAENEYSKKRKRIRYFIQEGESLTVAEVRLKEES